MADLRQKSNTHALEKLELQRAELKQMQASEPVNPPPVPVNPPPVPVNPPPVPVNPPPVAVNPPPAPVNPPPAPVNPPLVPLNAPTCAHFVGLTPPRLSGGPKNLTTSLSVGEAYSH
eukprot:54406-Prorocentrum_minimum.AAC.2